MTQNRGLSSSEQYIKKSNRKLLVLGIFIAIAFLFALVMLADGGNKGTEVSTLDYRDNLATQETFSDLSVDPFSRGTGNLIVEPKTLSMDNVVIGSKVEAVLTLTAQETPILFYGATLAETSTDGFTLESSCPENGVIEVNKSCTVKVLWNPVSLRQIQNNLLIDWKEDSDISFDKKQTIVQVKAQSTDSKDCIICETKENSANDKKAQALGLNGQVITQNDDGSITIDGKTYQKTENDLYIDENGNIIAVAEPAYIALNLENKVMGSIAKNGDVLDEMGGNLGRVLNDGTIVDSQLTVLGAKVPVVSVLNASGQVVGKMTNDATIINANNEVIATPAVDSSAIGVNGKFFGFMRPHGFVLDLAGNVLGAIIPDGTVINGQNDVLGKIMPNGLAFNLDGALIGGTVPSGVAVGANGLLLGTVSPNGTVVDMYNQPIAKVMIDGAVINDNNIEIGKVISQTLLINERSAIVGFVNSEGKAVSKQGNIIGTIFNNGTVMAGTKNVGAVMPHGKVIGYGCTQVGSVYPNGEVITVNHEVVGMVRADSYVKNKSNQIMGVVVPRAAAVADGCRLLGMVSITGEVLENGATKVGCMTPDYTVIDSSNKTIGTVAAQGNIYDNNGKVLGRARMDGKVVDLNGTIIGCVGLDNKVLSLNGEQLGAFANNGNSNTAQHVVINGVEGTITPNGVVIDKNGVPIAIMPPNGVIFSLSGDIIGRYSDAIGYPVDNNDEKLGQVLPDFTVLSVKNEIIGGLIANRTTFMDLNNEFLGTMSADGILRNDSGTVMGKIRADGSVVNENGKVIGVQIKTGPVYSITGALVGTAQSNGTVYSPENTEIGKTNVFGVAVNNQHQVIGGLYPKLSMAINAGGMMGFINASGAVIDKNGNNMGHATPFGLVMDLNNAITAKMVEMGTYVDENNKLIGWADFAGNVINTKNESIARILPNAMAYSKNQQPIGSLVKKGFAIATNGTLLSTITPKNTLLTDKNVITGIASSTDFIYDTNNKIMGKVLKMGVGVDVNGNYLGALRNDGAIGTVDSIKGYITLNNQLVSSDNKIIGQYIPFDSLAITAKNKTVGIVSETGQLITALNTPIGKIIGTQYVVQNGDIIARLVNNASFITPFAATHIDSIMQADGNTTNLIDSKLMGAVMPNGLAMDLTKTIIGAIMPMGTPLANTLSALGRQGLSGAIYNDLSVNAATSATTALFNASHKIVGAIMPLHTFIDRSGAIIGQSNGLGIIATRLGEKIATQMPLGTALTTNNMWAGGVLPLGVVVNDDGQKLGVVANDGTVLDDNEKVIARVLSDGAAASIQSNALYNVMPYAGGIAAQGLPYSYKNEILGRTTLNGNIINAMEQKTATSLDDATVLSKKEGLVGAILPFLPVISYNGTTLGTLSGNAHVLTNDNIDNGTISVNQVLKSSKYQIIGGMIPSRVIVNNCQVVGQTALNGQVIDAQGRIVGHILPDKTVISSQGEIIGREARNGIIMSPDGTYLGRTLPDGIITDLKGVSIGCVQNDGTAVNTNGDVIGAVIERGLVLGTDGKPLGRVKANGSVVDKDGNIIGTVLSNGTVVDSSGTVIGNALSRNQELLYDENGNIEGVFENTGIFYDAKTMEPVFRVDKNGNVYDSQNNLIGKIKDGQIYTPTGDKLDDLTLLKDKNGTVFGIVSGCDVVNSYGEKIGSIQASGKVVDLNNDVFAIIQGDGTILDKNNEPMGKVQGTNIALDRCGIQSVSGIASMATSGKGIFIGDKMYQISEKGSIINEEGIVVGYMGEDGKPYTLDNRQLTASGDMQGRSRPSYANQPTVSTEQIQQMKDILESKRSSMRELARSSVITPTKKIEAMARKKEDANWKSLGVNKNVSSYKVNMSRVLLKDKAIPAVLTRALDSRFSSVPVSAIVERHIYAETGRNIIIPAGSRIIGKMDGNSGSGQKVAKMNIVWERLIRPDGGAFTFEANSGDAQGRGGVAAYLDEQLVQKYGTPLATSVVTSSIGYMMAVNEDVQTNADTGTTVTSSKAEAASDARENFIDAMDQIFNQLIADSADVPEVTFVPAGTRLTVFSNEDLWLRSETEDMEDVEDEMGTADTSAQLPNTPSWVDNRTQQKMDYENEMIPQDTSSTTQNTPYRQNSDSVLANVVENAPDAYYTAPKTNPTPLYDGTKDAITTRKVSPLMPKESGGSSQLF